MQQSLPSLLCMLSASHHSISNQMVLMSLHIAGVSSPSVCLTANGSSVTLPRKTYPFNVQYLKTLQMKWTIWAAHMGIFIFTCDEHCLLVEAYTGAKVMPPKLPCNNSLGYSSGIGVLTAPFSSPNSRLLLFSKVSMFEWLVGTNSWLEHPLDLEHERIYQVVSFKGHILVVDALMRLHTIQLTPQFSINKVAMTWRSLRSFPLTTWLVVCGDMLLMVDLTIASRPPLSYGESNAIRFFEVFRLDFSVKPAKWVQMEKLENHALFLSLDRRNPTFSCMNPERWGGKSNCVYIAKLLDDANREETWTVLEIGQSVPHHGIVDTMMYRFTFPPDYSHIGSLWLFPSLVYGAAQ